MSNATRTNQLVIQMKSTKGKWMDWEDTSSAETGYVRIARLKDLDPGGEFRLIDRVTVESVIIA